MSGSARYAGHNPDKYVIRSLVRGLNGPVGRDLDRRSKAVLREARRTAPVRTGRILASLRRESGNGPGGPRVDIVAGVPGLTDYLGYQLFGTQPHVIRARRRKALRWVGTGGVLVFRKRVWHPGQRARNFLANALKAARD